MQSSNESEVKTPRLFLTQNGACFMSPNLLPTDPGTDTPNKLPTAPHPSPVNMDIEHLNPESKEIFRKQLLKACQLKIPEAIENSSNFEEGVLANISYTEVTSPVCEQIFTGLCKKDLEKNVYGDDQLAPQPEVDVNDIFEDDRNENSNFKEFLPHNEIFSSNFKYDFVKAGKSQSDLAQITFTNESRVEQISKGFGVNRSQAGNVNLHEVNYLKNSRKDAELSQCKIAQRTLPNENYLEHSNGDAAPDISTYPRIQAEFVDTLSVLKRDRMKPINDGKERSNLLDSMSIEERSVFYDPTADHVDLSLLLDSNSGWNNSNSYRSRSPCSDKLSTVANCASDASDISDSDFVHQERSMQDFEEDFGSSKDFESSKECRSKSFGSSKEFSSKSFGASKDFGSTKDCRPKKKPSENLVIRRFLRWRRCFKLRKRAASLDEGKFPFLANRFDSYQTEFELSV